MSSADFCAGCGEPFGSGDRYCEACGSRRADPRDHLEYALPGVAAVTDLGKRHRHNEDAVAIARLSEAADGVDAALVVISDGVSSGPRPDQASAEAVRAGLSTLTAALRDAIEPRRATERAALAAAAAVAALAEPGEMFGAPATTYISAVRTGDRASRAGEITVGWVGDSRAYWLPEDATVPGRQLTEDDSWLVSAIAEGIMSREDAALDPRAHALIRWLGADAGAVRPRTVTFRPERSGVLLVCTDGLWNYLPTPQRLTAALSPGFMADPLGAARHLVRVALDAGGRDNVTVALLPIDPGGAR